MQKITLDPFPLKKETSLNLVLIHEVKSPVFITDQDQNGRS